MIAAGRRSKWRSTSCWIFSSGIVPVPNDSTVQRDRAGDADAVGDLDLEPVGEPRRDDVLRDPARGVRGRPVDLRRILAAERAAAVTGHAAVRVDDDLAAGEPRVAHRAAGHEPPRRVHVDDRVRLAQLPRDRRQDHGLGDVVAQAIDVDIGVVLGGDDDRTHGDGRPLAVLDRDLGLAVGPQVRELPDLRDAASCRAIRCAIAIGSGMSSGVSRQANPNIIPWSPAPELVRRPRRRDPRGRRPRPGRCRATGP